MAEMERLPALAEQALIKAECALADIAEGEGENNDTIADALEWAEQRAAKALARIRPIMRQYGILTSEWPNFPDPELEILRRLDAMEENTAECIVDLRRSVQVLADTVRQLRVDHIRLINACAAIAPDRNKFFAATMADDDNSELPPP